MCGFLLRIIINAVILFIAVVQLPGIFVDTLGSTLLGAAIIGTANAAIRPLMELTSVPLTITTLSGLTFFANILTPFMVVKTLPGFQISSVLAPFAAILLVTVCSCTLTKIIQDR